METLTGHVAGNGARDGVGMAPTIGLDMGLKMTDMGLGMD